MNNCMQLFGTLIVWWCHSWYTSWNYKRMSPNCQSFCTKPFIVEQCLVLTKKIVGFSQKPFGYWTTLKYVPETNQYWLTRVNIFTQWNNGDLHRQQWEMKCTNCGNLFITKAHLTGGRAHLTTTLISSSPQA